MKLHEVVGLEVLSRLGDRLGRVVDFRCASEPEHGEGRPHCVVTEVVFGKAGWLERMGVRAVLEETVPWAEIETFGTQRITLKRD